MHDYETQITIVALINQGNSLIFISYNRVWTILQADAERNVEMLQVALNQARQHLISKTEVEAEAARLKVVSDALQAKTQTELHDMHQRYTNSESEASVRLFLLFVSSVKALNLTLTHILLVLFSHLV